MLRRCLLGLTYLGPTAAQVSTSEAFLCHYIAHQAGSRYPEALGEASSCLCTRSLAPYREKGTWGWRSRCWMPVSLLPS